MMPAAYTYTAGSEYADSHTMQLIDPDRADRLGLPPEHWIVKEYAQPERVAGMLERDSAKVRYLLDALQENLPKFRFLEKQLNNPEFDNHPQRDDAVWRKGDYLRRVREEIDLLIMQEWRSDRGWRYLRPIERIELGVAALWGVDPAAESLIGTVFFGVGGCSLGSQFGDQISELFGRVDWLNHIKPYREDIANYVWLGWLEGTLGEDAWSAARVTEQRKQAAIASNRRVAQERSW